MAQSAAADSMDSSAARADSALSVDRAADAGLREQGEAPWVHLPEFFPRDADRRPSTVADALRDWEGVRLRQAGDPGARSFLSLSPIDAGAPELYIDGVPTRSPSDVAPSIHDQSGIGIGGLRNSSPRWDVGGPFALHAELEPALEGRTRLRSHFNFTANETYYRGLSWTTPRAARSLRFDYEEWKTEEGYPSYVAAVSRPSRFGRAKQRRFEFTGQSRSDWGQLSLRFGRGRRFHDGQMLGSNPERGAVERWTGAVVAGIDRADSNAHTRARFFHLDWQDVDDAHEGQTRDAVRLGVLARRSVREHGWSWMLQAERRAGAFVDAGGLVWRPAALHVARVGLGHDAGRVWRRMARLELAANDVSDERMDVGGTLALQRNVRGVALRAGGERRLRMPTLMELGGSWQTDFADGSHRFLRGGGALPMERQDRIHAGLSGRSRGFQWGLMAEWWRLTRGTRWQVVSADEARFDDGAKLEMPLARLELRRGIGNGRRGMWAELRASHMLDVLQNDANRGAGWPRTWARLSAGAWTRLFHDYNRLSLSYSLVDTGKRLDDLAAPLVMDPRLTVLPRESRHDLRLTLRIRDAELYLLWENLADATIQDLSATRLRGRQRVWGLFWDFYN